MPVGVFVLRRSTLSADSPEWFEVIGAGDVVLAKKPAPDLHECILARLGLPAEECGYRRLRKRPGMPGYSQCLYAGAGFLRVLARTVNLEQVSLSASLALEEAGV